MLNFLKRKTVWHLADAEKMAKDFPYTFYRSSKTVLDQINTGNLVKLFFEYENEKLGGERMWVKISSKEDKKYTGILENNPTGAKGLSCGDLISFEEKNIVDSDIEDKEPSLVEKYIKRCIVTNDILYESSKIDYLYREESDNENDSGWRFLSNNKNDDYVNNPKNVSCVSLGAVLRQDDSVLDLLEPPIGSAFEINSKGVFQKIVS